MLRKVRSSDLVQLGGRAAGRCSYPECRKSLVLVAPGSDLPVNFGEAAHIVAHLPRGPRGDISIPPDGLDRYPNLILLCSNHHIMVDRRPEVFPADTTNSAARLPWIAIVQQDRFWIERPALIKALAPLGRIDRTIELRNDPSPDTWPFVSARELTETAKTIDDTPSDRRRFAVLSLGRIPLAVQLGFALGDRGRVALFHYDRDHAAWSWPDASPTTPPAPVAWTSSESDGPRDEAAIRVSLSSEVLPEPRRRCAFAIDIRIPEPTVRWLQVPGQLTEPSHLYYAGPAITPAPPPEPSASAAPTTPA